jgi:2,3-bisphosphoglycerate-independent phosphoglycerate mutase
MSSIFIKNTEENNLGSWISQHNLKQLRVAETEKYPHVTFFFNGGKEDAEILEDRYMPESPKVETYDIAPEMAATEITKKVLDGLNLKYSFILANYANPDMVGHTGNLKATIKACETIDLELEKIIKKLKVSNGIMLIISDHGNCEKMINSETRQPHTAHTLNLVPAILVGYESEITLRDGRLSDIAPTILDLMNLPKPSEMTGKTLIIQGH